jgi:hypothetical protein
MDCECEYGETVDGVTQKGVVVLGWMGSMQYVAPSLFRASRNGFVLV